MQRWDDLLKFAAGWKGWTDDYVLFVDINYILKARDGHIEMLKAIFGSKEESKGPVFDARGRQITMAPNVFDAQFGKPFDPSMIRRKH